MKTCIWCRCTEDKSRFKNPAHTIPQSLGGNSICENVCDNCNLYFGTHFNGSPSVETIIKETFNVSRFRFLSADNQVGKNKNLAKFTSIYFDANFKQSRINLKFAYKRQKGFQERIGRQLKKGLYKMFLEETERQKGIGLDPNFDFIREFSRYDLGDYPVFYFERTHGLILVAKDWVTNPKFHLDETFQMKYIVQEPNFFEFEFMGHVFGIATSRYWELTIDNYLKKTSESKKQFFKSCKLVNSFNDIDLMLSILDK